MPRPHADDRRAVILARVSSAEQAEGYSLDAQLGLLREYAATHGLEVVAEHELAESAKRAGDRKRFKDILADLRRPRAPRHLIVEKSDRLARNMGDAAAIDDLRQAGLQVHLVKQGRVLTPASGSSDMLAWEIGAVLDRHYVRNLSEEVRKGMAEKKRQGGWTHLAPLGLRNVDGRIEHDPERAHLVRAIAERVVSDGLTMASAAALAGALGLTSRTGRLLRPGDLASLLRSPLLAGLVPLDGGWAGGRHVPAVIATAYRAADWEPVIPDGAWRALQALLDSRVRRSGRVAPTVGIPRVLAGLLRCGACGSTVTTESHAGRHGKGRYVYYRCASGSKSDCGKAYAKEERLLEQVAERLKDLAIPEAALRELRTGLQQASQVERRERDALIRRARASADKAQRRIDAGVDLAADGAISRAELAAIRRRSAEEQARADVQVSAVAEADRRWVDDALQALDVLRDASRLFGRATAVEKRVLVETLFGERTLQDGTLALAYCAPWASAETAAAAEQLKRASVEEVRTCDAAEGANPSWLTRRDPGGNACPETVAAALAMRAHPAAVAALLAWAA